MMEIIVDEEKSNKFNKDKVINLFKNKYFIILLIILTIAFIVRFNYYNINEAVWWDSADYLTGAKYIYNSELRENLSQFELNPKRPFFLSLFWGLILYLGGGDRALHFSVLIFSVLGVLLTYLIGRDMYNEKVGLIAAFLMAVLWNHLFHTARLLTDVVALTFWLATVFFFWKGYIKNEGNKWIFYAGIFLGLAIFTRAASIINFVPLIILMLVKDRTKVIKDKNIWISLFLVFLVMSPFLIWLFVSFDNPIDRFTGMGGEGGRFRKGESYLIGIGDLWRNLNYIPLVILTPILINALGLSGNVIGFLILLLVFGLSLDLFLGLDILFKNRDKDLLKKLFLLVWILTPYVVYSVFNPGVEDRYLFAMFPAMFILFGLGLLKIENLFKNVRYKKVINLGIILLILGIIVVPQLIFAHSAIISKSKGFAEIKYGGEWIKENSEISDRVISASKYQNMYYSERDTFPFPQREEEFEGYLKEVKPRYVVISVYEPGFTPDWVLNYQTKHPILLRPVQGYFGDEAQTQPILIIFEYSGYFEQIGVNQSS